MVPSRGIDNVAAEDGTKVPVREAEEAVLAAPSTSSKRWARPAPWLPR
jgi:hypothetical protein